jgi:6,7-dimethyl-8-ribityllumazine synthase
MESTHGARQFIKGTKVDAVICLGCVIKGDTPHFDYVCQGVTQGITSLNVKYEKPVIFGVLTTNNQQQAIDRAGGKLGNKGDEGAVTAIKMVALSRELKNS